MGTCAFTWGSQMPSPQSQVNTPETHGETRLQADHLDPTAGDPYHLGV